MARWTINDWNTRIDRTKTVMWVGANGIHYEYIMPLHSNPFNFHQEAVDVRSHKSPTSKWSNGKRPGEYQPVGDKRYFTYYQLKQMKRDGRGEDYIKMVSEILERFYNAK